jgi:hypothetical protein
MEGIARGLCQKKMQHADAVARIDRISLTVMATFQPVPWREFYNGQPHTQQKRTRAQEKA